MNCDCCARAEADPLTGWIRSGCPECTARALAGSPSFYASQAMGKFRSDYRAALELAAGDGWEAMHQRVKAWARRIDEARATA